jgi:hypothetical protein
VHCTTSFVFDKPNRCVGCRKANKAKVVAEAAAVVATEEQVIAIVEEAFAEKPTE